MNAFVQPIGSAKAFVQVLLNLGSIHKLHHPNSESGSGRVVSQKRTKMPEWGRDYPKMTMMKDKV